MLIKVLYDKDTLDKNLYTGWGVSFLIEDKVLFDTGENGRWLIKNMEKLNVDLNRLEMIVISHEHWDHTGGLWELLKERRGLNVYACPHFSPEFKNKVSSLMGNLVEAERCAQISKNIYVTGQISGEYAGQYIPEQALILKTNNGISIITGCAHPGIMKILEEVKESFPNESVYLVMGGFHLIDKERRVIKLIVEEFKKIGVKKVGPTHCSGREAQGIFKNKYKENFISIKVGQILEV